MKRLAVARKEVIDTNKRLKELNEELHLSMHKLKAVSYTHVDVYKRQ